MITGGEVSFRRVIQTAPYETAEAQVRLTVSLEDGEEEQAIRDALKRARSMALEALRRKSNEDDDE